MLIHISVLSVSSSFHLWQYLTLMLVIATHGKEESPTISAKKVHSASIIPWSAAFDAAAGWGWEEDLLLLPSRPGTAAGRGRLLPGRRAVSHWRQPQLIRAPPATLATLLLLLLLLLQPAPPRMDLSRAQQPAVSNPLCSIWEENDCSLRLPAPSWTLWVSHCLALSCCRMVLSNVCIPHYSLQQRDSNGLDHHLDDKDVVPGVT